VPGASIVIRRNNGWLRSDASSQEMSVVIRNSCSSIGSAPPTRVAVRIPLPMASALCNPIIPQSLAIVENRVIGPIRPKVSDNSQMASPTPIPARINLLRRRTCKVRDTAVNPLIRLVTKSGASIGPNKTLLQRLTKNAA
jgi:hypothetical protein